MSTFGESNVQLMGRKDCLLSDENEVITSTVADSHNEDSLQNLLQPNCQYVAPRKFRMGKFTIF